MVGNVMDFSIFGSNSGILYRWYLCNSEGKTVASGTYVAVISVEFANGEKKIQKQTIGVIQ